jgi:hypothetical protein
MRVKFPWYKRMYTLLSGSPVYDTSALANSATPLDTSVLSTPNRQYSPDWDDAAIDGSSLNDSLLPETLFSIPPSPHFGPELPELNGVPDTSFPAAPLPTPSLQADISATPTAAVMPRLSVSKTSSSSSLEAPGAARKRKDPFEQVRELAATYTNSRLESERVRAESKRQRLENELNIQQLKNEAQDRQCRHEAEERERQRQHELQIMEKQIILAQLQAGSTNVGNASANTAHAQGYDNYSQGF